MNSISETSPERCGFAALLRVTVAVRRAIFLSAVMIVAVGSVTEPLHAATVSYNFTYTEGAGPLLSTTFHLDEPKMLTPGIYAIPSFSMTDGANTWTFTKLAVDRAFPTLTDTCLAFGTSATTLDPNSGCSAGGGYPLSGVFILFFSNTMLSAPGLYLTSGIAFAAVDQFGKPVQTMPGSAILDLTTPEPSTAALLLPGMLIFGVVLRRHCARIEQPARLSS